MQLFLDLYCVLFVLSHATDQGTFCTTFPLEVNNGCKTLKFGKQLSADCKEEELALSGVQQRGGDINGPLQGHFIQTDVRADGIFLLLHPFWSLKQYRIILIHSQRRGGFSLDGGKHPSHPCLRANIDLQPKCVCHVIPAYFCSDVKDLCRQHEGGKGRLYWQLPVRVACSHRM